MDSDVARLIIQAADEVGKYNDTRFYMIVMLTCLTDCVNWLDTFIIGNFTFLSNRNLDKSIMLQISAILYLSIRDIFF